MGSSKPTFEEDSLSSDFLLASTDTSWTDTGLEKPSVTLSDGDFVRVFCQGTIINQNTDNFSILAQIVCGATTLDEWYESDGNISLHRKSFTLVKKFNVGNGASDLLTPGTYTFKLQGDNNQGTDVIFSGTGNQACRLEIEIFS